MRDVLEALESSNDGFYMYEGLVINVLEFADDVHVVLFVEEE